MDSVLLDTNVLLDFLATTRPEHDVVVSLIRQLQEDGIGLCVAATSLKDVYYILGRTDGEPAARRAVESVLMTSIVLPVDDTCCRMALSSTEPDFEDGIIRAAAEIGRVDYLVTRDRGAFIGSAVPKVSPGDLLRELRFSK